MRTPLQIIKEWRRNRIVRAYENAARAVHELGEGKTCAQMAGDQALAAAIARRDALAVEVDKVVSYRGTIDLRLFHEYARSGE